MKKGVVVFNGALYC